MIMPDDSHRSLDLLIAELVESNRPQNQPAFEALEVRWRRRRVRRRGAAVAAVALIAATVPGVLGVLGTWPDGRNPVRPGATYVPIDDCGVTSPYSPPVATEFIGLTLDDALSLAAQRGMSVRIFGQDGQCETDAFTGDLRSDRVNLYLEEGRVVSASRY
jgi:hypothetical protein